MRIQACSIIFFHQVHNLFEEEEEKKEIGLNDYKVIVELGVFHYQFLLMLMFMCFVIQSTHKTGIFGRIELFNHYERAFLIEPTYA